MTRAELSRENVVVTILVVLLVETEYCPPSLSIMLQFASVEDADSEISQGVERHFALYVSDVNRIVPF